MRNSSNLKIAVFALAAIGIGLGVGWYASRPKTVATQAITVTETESGEKITTQTEGKDDPSRLPAYKQTVGHRENFADAAGAPMRGATMTATTDTNELITDWDDKVSDIIVSDSPFTNKCAEMLEMFPHMPEAGQVETSHHLSNLTQDENYAPLGKILMDPKTSTNVDEVLMTDVLNRGNNIKLPVLLQVARTPNHPKAAEARDMLGRLLEADYNTDWTGWEQKIRTYLKENPD